MLSYWWKKLVVVVLGIVLGSAVSILVFHAHIESSIVTAISIIALWFLFTRAERKRLREQIQRERYEEQEQSKMLREAQARSRAATQTTNRFRGILHGHHSVDFVAPYLGYILPKSEDTYCLNYELRGYYLDTGGVQSMPVKNSYELLRGRCPHKFMVIEATWEEHEQDTSCPVDPSYWFPPKEEFVLNRALYLYWPDLPIWESIEWTQERVVLRDLFGRRITLTSPTVQQVLEFVVCHESVADAVLYEIARIGGNAIYHHPNGSEALARVRSALMNGKYALVDGRFPMTVADWEGLSDRDPLKR